jgi:hypothetical protein
MQEDLSYFSILILSTASIMPELGAIYSRVRHCHTRTVTVATHSKTAPSRADRLEQRTVRSEMSTENDFFL